jgi:hypothetical protein
MPYAILLVFAAWACAAGQEVPSDNVVPLQSASLKEGPEQARKIRTTGSLWVAYRVEVKPNIAIDTHEVNVPWDATIHGPDVSVNVSPSTAALGIFVRYDENKAIQIEVFNLGRKHDFGSAPVFWLGQKPNGDSLSFLLTLLKTLPNLGVGLVRAIGIHRDSRSADILRAHGLVSTLSNRAREEALCWIGQSYGQSSFLGSLASDARLSIDERSAAVLALLESPDPAARPEVTRLRSQVKERRIQALIEGYNRGAANSPRQTNGPTI